MSANPLEMRDPQLRRPFRLTTDDPSGRQAFCEECRRVHEDLFEQLNGFRTSVGVAPARPTS